MEFLLWAEIIQHWELSENPMEQSPEHSSTQSEGGQSTQNDNEAGWKWPLRFFFTILLFLGLGLIGFIVLLVFVPDYRKPHHRPSDEAICSWTLRSLIGAIETYNMDASPSCQIESCNPTTIKILLESGIPHVRIDKPDPRCRYESLGNLTSDSSTLYCVIHGTYEQCQAIVQEKEAEEKSFRGRMKSEFRRKWIALFNWRP